MKLLFPVDGSDFALAALAKFSTMLSLFREKSELILINVQLPSSHPSELAYLGKEVEAQYYDVQSEEELTGARERLERGGFNFRIEKRVGDPADEIVSLAKAERCEMIAMGTSGRSALKNLVMGSVATKVLAASTVPVLFLK